MIVELEKYLQNLLPWDLTIQVRGVGHHVRPLTLGDLVSLESVARGQGVEVGRLVALVQGLFVAPQPDVASWPPQYLMPVIVKVLSYFAEFTKKNGAIVAAAMAPTVAPTPPAATTSKPAS